MMNFIHAAPTSRTSSPDMSATSSTATPTAGTHISTIIEELEIASKRKAGETVIDVARITAEKFEELCSELHKHNNRRTEPDRLLSGHRMKLIDGALTIYKFSRGAHEKITRRIDQMIAGQNVALWAMAAAHCPVLDQRVSSMVSIRHWKPTRRFSTCT